MHMPETWLQIPVGDSGIYRNSGMSNTTSKLVDKTTPANHACEKKLHLDRGWEIKNDRCS